MLYDVFLFFFVFQNYWKTVSLPSKERTADFMKGILNDAYSTIFFLFSLPLKHYVVDTFQLPWLIEAIQIKALKGLPLFGTNENTGIVDQIHWKH